MLKGTILNEVIHVMNVCAPNDTAATFIKNTIGHAKRNKKHTNTGRL